MAKKAIKKDVKKAVVVKKELDTLVLVKVGTVDCPAMPEDITDAKKSFLKDKDLSVLITHHAIDVILIDNSKDSFTLFKIGDEERPALEEELKDFEKEYEEAIKERRPIFWNHRVNAITYPRSAFNFNKD